MPAWLKRALKSMVPPRISWFPRYHALYRTTIRRAAKDVLMLDAGCGDGIMTGELAKKGFRVIGADRCADALKAEASKREGAAFIACDILDLPFKDGSFGFVFSLDVLDLFTDIDGAFDELARVLKKGGTLAFSIPDGCVCSAELFWAQKLLRKVTPPFLMTRGMPGQKAWLETTTEQFRKTLGVPAGYSPDRIIEASGKHFVPVSRRHHIKLFTSLAVDIVYGIKGCYYLRFPLFYIAVRMDEWLLKRGKGYAMLYEMRKR